MTKNTEKKSQTTQPLTYDCHFLGTNSLFFDKHCIKKGKSVYLPKD